MRGWDRQKDSYRWKATQADRKIYNIQKGSERDREIERKTNREEERKREIKIKTSKSK